MKQFFQVDAFTQKPFCGNTAGVVLMDEVLPDETMKFIATQNNLPATAFVQREKDNFNIRWFSPTKELPLCGHASLASAHILFANGLVAADRKITFQTKGGPLYAQRKNNWIELDFPAYECKPASVPADLNKLFATTFRSAALTLDRYIIELEKEEDVRNFTPDFTILRKYKCILTSSADAHASYDFVSRYFALPDGVAEDAVTGSSHCSLTPYWAERLGKTEMHAFQVSSRGGELKVALRDNRVLIGGQAVTVIAGQLLL